MAGDAVREIKEKLSILDVISPYVELHKAGKNFKGKSPFSAEKTPSFYVSPDRGMYYCFSTSQGGDMFTFIQAMEGVDFKESLQILAQKAGVELVPEDPQKRSERERLYASLEAATSFYESELQKESGAMDYLNRRGVKVETISKWRIGYAPGPPKHGWRETKDALEAKNFTKDELLKAGLIKNTDSGKEPFDVFRDRIVFPMAESGGKVVAFSGRILAQDSQAPKYVNSPETQLYKKSELLFGYDKAKEGIRKLNFSLIVEGQFDVVMCHQAGYNNTVAVSGTALTLHHVQLLERLSEKVVLALDADRAGINAMKKGAELMLSRGLDVKVAEMPPGEDPADMIEKDPANFKKVIGHSVHVIEFLLHVLKQEITDERSFKLRAREEILPFILLLPSRIDQEHFVSLVADSISSTADAIRFELDRLREDSAKEITRPVEAVGSETENTGRSGESTSRAYEYLLGACEVIDNKMADLVKKEIIEILKISKLPEPEPADLSGVTFILEQQFAKLPQLAIEEELTAKLNQLKHGLIRAKVSGLREQLKVAELEGEESVFNDSLKSISEYETKLREPAYKPEEFFEEKS